MKSPLLLMALLLLSFFTTQKQSIPNVPEERYKETFEQAEESSDDEAEAIVLFDKAKSYFVHNEGSFDIVFERKTRIKILSEAGVKWAEIEIPFYEENDLEEKVYEIEAFSFNSVDGKMIKTDLDLSDTFDEKINNFWNMKKFAIPNVQAGTIIEYSYKIRSPYLFNLRDWEFQWRIPVIYSEYEVKMIPFLDYTFLLQGVNKFDSQSSYADQGFERQFGPVTFRDMVYKFAMKNLPAFNNEEFITSINDYIIKIDFQLAGIKFPGGGPVEIMTTWEKMIKTLLKYPEFGKYIDKSEKLAGKLINVENLDQLNEKEKFNYVLEYVKNNYSWNLESNRYATKTPNKFVVEKQGNCADLNLFTIGLLRAVGIDANPVLTSTRAHGKIKYDYPYTHFFNYVVIMAHVNDELLLSDATETLSLNNRIPSRCINDKGLVIEDDEITWIGLECLFTSEIQTDIQLELSKEDIITSTITKTATEYEATQFRNNYSDNIEKIKKRLLSNDIDLIDNSISVQNQFNKAEPYILTYSSIDKPEIVNEKIYLAPFLNEVIAENPLKQNERTYPVDMTYPSGRTYKSSILIPEGYKLEYLPADKTIKSELFELNYSAQAVDGKIEINFDYQFKNSVYSSDNYLEIKSFFTEIVKNGNDKIVFTKKQ